MLLLAVILSLPVNLGEYVRMISGTFSTRNQSMVDSTFDHVVVHTQPIRRDSTGVWVYTQQGTINTPPYRQRVYHITSQDTVLVQKTYMLKNPTKVSPRSIQRIRLQDLEYKAGCDILIRKESPTAYIGNTDDRSCSATFRNSTYVTTSFMVTPHIIASWERGWDDSGKQVWGSTHGHYIYEKVRH